MDVEERRLPDSGGQSGVGLDVASNAFSERPAPFALKGCLRRGRGKSRKRVQIREEANVTFEIPNRKDLPAGLWWSPKDMSKEDVESEHGNV